MFSLKVLTFAHSVVRIALDVLKINPYQYLLHTINPAHFTLKHKTLIIHLVCF